MVSNSNGEKRRFQIKRVDIRNWTVNIPHHGGYQQLQRDIAIPAVAIDPGPRMETTARADEVVSVEDLTGRKMMIQSQEHAQEG